MKRNICLLLCCTSFTFADERYVNEIRVQPEHGQPYQFNNHYLPPSGTELDNHAALGSLKYSLYTIKLEDNTAYFLDEKTVSTYHPQATIKITSLDPYVAIPRTRVDYPFSIEYSISGIVTDDPSVHEAAKSVVFDHRVTQYAPGTTEVASNASYTVHDHDPVTQNGTFNINTIMTQIQSTNLPTARGEEIFSIYANPDYGTTGIASLLAQKRIQIWPIAKGHITGIDTTIEYAKVPSVTVELIDLYPWSQTYMRFYKGAPVAEPSTVKRFTWFKNKDDVTPETITFTLDELDAQIPEDATYTVELIHETPFGADLLGQVYPLKVKRSIKINGNVNSSE